MSYNNAIPQPTDFIADSQVQILNNFSSADTSFGVDHYAFSDTTGDSGKHDQVTTPLIVGSAHPSTAASEPKFYGMQDSANLGVIQYSRGPSDAVPTPLTKLQSPAAGFNLAASATSNILDFTGLPNALLQTFIVATRTSSGNRQLQIAFVRWESTGTLFTINQVLKTDTATGAVAFNTGNILQVKNNGTTERSNIFWTVEFLRIWT